MAARARTSSALPGVTVSVRARCGCALNKAARSCAERIVGQLDAEDVGQRAQDRPVLARIAGREGGAPRHLHAAFGVDEDAGLLGIGRAGQDDVGALGAAVAMGADIDHERAGLDLDLVGAEQEQEIDAALRHRLRREAVLAGNEADVEAADPRRRGVKDAKAVPAVGQRTDRDRGLGRRREHGGAVGPRQRALPDQPDLPLQRGRLVVEERGQRVRTGAEIGVIVGEIGMLADDPDLEAAGAPALANAGIEHRGFLARIGPDDHEAVGLVDPGDGRVEEVAGAAPFGIERGAVLAAVEMGRAEPPDQLLEGEHLLDRAEIAGDGADAAAPRRLHPRGDRPERLRP